MNKHLKARLVSIAAASFTGACLAGSAVDAVTSENIKEYGNLPVITIFLTFSMALNFYCIWTLRNITLAAIPKHRREGDA